MNRFRTRKRAKDDAAPTPRASHESESPAPFRLFGKPKKSQEEEPKKELDLENALPPSDDFRTSLLMTGLSARFSMLREQDDPNTKIGKASDDSVLFPKRQSRMDFGFGPGLGLSDIAEVESIRKGAPFARMDSIYSADGNSVSGSIMDRAKPGEGNNLFGGRQKIFKIAAGSSSSKNVDGMSGRALYEDDVAMSAFQKWRQAERAASSFEDEQDLAQSSSSLDIPLAESPPPMNYDRKRETNSTTSSTPSLGRNSTAATSVMSQPTTSSAKDWQAATTAPNSATGTPLLDRSVTRSKRLYETGLNNELQEQQSSALSRMDTLSRQRNLGTKTPEFLQNGSSPTSSLFSDRFAERRILAKASAPNLRSGSPSATGSPITPVDMSIRNLDPKPAFGGTPPLSPPISEGEESAILPNDRGKATAMGMFQKPLHSYDDSKYAQRQLQLQQGRETPTNRFRTESSSSRTADRSRSSSSAQRLATEKTEPSAQKEPTLKEEAAESTYPNGKEGSKSPEDSQRRALAAVRPADRDHPAFRDSALPTPLSPSSRISSELSPISDQPFPSVFGLQSALAEDSPTLPQNSGLSGMVRQHLRTDSATSSLYSSAPQTSTFASKFPLDPYEYGASAGLGVISNPWEVPSPEWTSPTSSEFANIDQRMDQKEQPAAKPKSDSSSEPRPPPEQDAASNTKNAKEHDEFADRLASGARRVRERLTSYVESDRDSRSLSPHSVDRTREPSLPRPNALGILRSKTSRGSLGERVNRENSQHSKAIKMLGLASSTISSAPSPNKSSFEEKEPRSLIRDEREKSDSSRPETAKSNAPAQEEAKDLEDDPMPAGLRAFRQARKELQKLRDVDSPRNVPPPALLSMPGTLPGSVVGPMVGPPASRTAPSRERTPGGRSPSRERRPPPITYQRTPSEGPKPGPGPGRGGSRPPSRTERDRSGSEASNGERSQRPARLRTTSSPYEDRGVARSPNGPNTHSAKSPRTQMQSPGLPGTNIRRSPIMPPQPHPNAAAATSPRALDRSVSSGNLTVQNRRRGPDPAQLSPVSPMAPMPSPTVPSIPASQSTPSFVPSRRPSAPSAPSSAAEPAPASRLDESLKRVVKKKDISEPTFVSSTSRVPTVALPETSETRPRSGSRSRSGSLLGAAASTPNLHSHANTDAPPLPPINPKRRHVLGSIMGRRGEEAMGASAPHLPLAPPSLSAADQIGDSHSAFSVSDDEEGTGSQRRRLRKTISEANGISMRSRLTRGASPPDNTPSPSAIPSGVNNSAMPGGMI